MKNSADTTMVIANAGGPVCPGVDVVGSAWWSGGNETKRKQTAKTNAQQATIQRKADKTCCCSASKISGEQATAPMPHAKLSRLTMPAPPASAAERLVGGTTMP